jgi:hypothetical protein
MIEFWEKTLHAREVIREFEPAHSAIMAKDFLTQVHRVRSYTRHWIWAKCSGIQVVWKSQELRSPGTAIELAHKIYVADSIKAEFSKFGLSEIEELNESHPFFLIKSKKL